MNDIPKRKTNRLKEYDYSQNGAYFITVCTKNHSELFGHIVGDAALGVPTVYLSECGKIVRGQIENIPKANPIVRIPYQVIMPNHIHMILVIEMKNENGTPKAASPTKALVPVIINALKGLSSKSIGFPIWQRSFHDHIIRNQDDYNRIAEYIENNPARWAEDRYYTG